MKYLRAICITLALSACSKSSDLDRGEAGRILTSHFNGYEQGKQTVFFRDGGEIDGNIQGFWSATGNIYEKGTPYFNWVDTSPKSPSFSPKKTFDVIVNVTGIKENSQNPSAKVVEFSVSNENISGPARRFALAECKGSAPFDLFDDGWRVDKAKIALNCDKSSSLKLSPADQKSLDADIRAVEEQAEADLKESNTPKTSKLFSCSLKTQYRQMDIYNFTVTDVGMKFSGNGGDSEWSYRDVASINTQLSPIIGALMYVNTYDGKVRAVYSEHCPDWNEALEYSIKNMNDWKAKYESPEDS